MSGEDSPCGEPSPDHSACQRIVDSQRESVTGLHLNRLNSDVATAPRRYYIDEDAPEPEPLLPEPLLPEPLCPEPLWPVLPCWEFTSSIAA